MRMTDDEEEAGSRQKVRLPTVARKQAANHRQHETRFEAPLSVATRYLHLNSQISPLALPGIGVSAKSRRPMVGESRGKAPRPESPDGRSVSVFPASLTSLGQWRCTPVRTLPVTCRWPRRHPAACHMSFVPSASGFASCFTSRSASITTFGHGLMMNGLKAKRLCGYQEVVCTLQRGSF